MEEKYKGLGTKVSPEFHKLFRRICHKKGLKTYEAIQMMAEAFVRYTDDQHNLSEEMERLMMLFEHMRGWRNAFNLADATPDKDITEAIYMLTAKGKKGARAVMVHRPYMGDWTETVNVQVILERVIEVLMPERYSRLRSLAIDFECNSIIELLDVLLTRHSHEADEAEFRKDFEDCRRGDFGQLPHEGEPYVKHHHKTVEKYEQSSFDFTDADVSAATHSEEERERLIQESEEARKWLIENTDGDRPFCSEW